GVPARRRQGPHLAGRERPPGGAALRRLGSGRALLLLLRHRLHPRDVHLGSRAAPRRLPRAARGAVLRRRRERPAVPPVTLSLAGHADLAGAQKYGLADVRDALERASARQTAVAVAAGAVAKALMREIGVEVEGTAVAGVDPGEIDAARADRDTLGGVVEVRARGVPPG